MFQLEAMRNRKQVNVLRLGLSKGDLPGDLTTLVTVSAAFKFISSNSDFIIKSFFFNTIFEKCIFYKKKYKYSSKGGGRNAMQSLGSLPAT